MRAGSGVVVEFVLFCPLYEDSMWSVSPMNARNNVNGVGDVARTEVLALKDARLTEVQDDMVRKIVSELRDFDNVYYEICNEPYFGGVTLEWQDHISQVIVETEAGFREEAPDRPEQGQRIDRDRASRIPWSASSTSTTPGRRPRWR